MQVVRMYPTLLCFAYYKYSLWYIPPDITRFGCDLRMAKEVAPRSSEIVREVTLWLYVIESTLFQHLQDS